MMGMDLSEFLLARIAEDEAVAQQAITERQRVRPDWTVDTEVSALDWPSVAAVGGERWLAECDAKRRIVESCRPQYPIAYRESEALLAAAFDQDRVKVLASGGPLWPHAAAEAILKALALPYADHPDYREEWRL